MIQQYCGLLIYLFPSFDWVVFLNPKGLHATFFLFFFFKHCSQQGRYTLTAPPPPPFPPLPPYAASLPESLSFSLTFPQSNIKSCRLLEEHIKVLWPVKSYKPSALQCHYVLQPPPISLPLSLSLLVSPFARPVFFFSSGATTAFSCAHILKMNGAPDTTLGVNSRVGREPLVFSRTSRILTHPGFYTSVDLSA